MGSIDRTVRRVAAVAVLAMAVPGPAPAAGATPARGAYIHAGVGEIVDVPFSATVTNTNNSTAACVPGPDGKTYPIKGHLTGPREALTRLEPAVALYYHGLSYGEFFWRFRAVPGY